jgi:hypothetical protein
LRSQFRTAGPIYPLQFLFTMMLFYSSAALAIACIGYAHATTQLFDDFTTSCPPNANFNTPTWQWGGNINGGVVPGNVRCEMDATLGKQVLVLESHGDYFNGTGPIGTYSNGKSRGPTDEWVNWKWPEYQPKCSPHCDVKRVGGAIMTNLNFQKGGSFEINMKPCPQMGTASAIFTYFYKEESCGSPDKPNIRNQCSPAYTKQCCINGDCTINPNGKTGDVCRGHWIQDQEIDIEIPTGLSSGINSVNPALVSFDNARMNALTATPWEYTFHTMCGVSKVCESDNYIPLAPTINQADGKYHKYRLEWTPGQKVMFYVDDQLQNFITGPTYVPEQGQLVIAAWFPNGWTGSPQFDTCKLQVDYIKVQ